MQDTALELFSLNCESQKHVDLILSHLKTHPYDVICLQEVFATHAAQIAEQLGLQYVFGPMATISASNQYDIAPLGEWGIAIFSRLPLSNSQKYYYQAAGNPVPEFIDGIPNSLARLLLSVDITKNDTLYRIATTHFTWSQDGSPNDEQRDSLQKILLGFEQLGEFVVCGDFNIPRGSELYTELTKHVTDQIPPAIQNTLDPAMHRIKNIEIVIDYIFTTPSYTAQNVGMTCHLSDHCAVHGTIQKQ